MSQKPATSGSTIPRVSGGVPIWLWGVLILIGGWIVVSFAMQAVPQDPAKIYADTIAAIKGLNRIVAKENADKLRAFPEYANKTVLIDGMMELAEGRPLKAIKRLQGLVEDKEIRPMVLITLGNAHAQADQRWKAIEIFETLIKEDSNANDARFALAMLYNQIIAWDRALEHLNILIEQKYQLSVALELRSVINAELGDFTKAVDDLGQAITSSPNDPQNGARAGTLMRLIAESDQLDRAKEYLQYVDQSLPRNVVEANRLLKEGDLNGAYKMALEVRTENAIGLPASKTLSKVMLAYGTKEKAIEGLAMVRYALVGQRDKELYRDVAQLARLAEDEEFASLVQQNVDQLDVLHKQFEEKLKQVVKTVDDPAIRIELYHLALEVGQANLALKIIEGLEAYYPDRDSEWLAMRQKLVEGVKQLVNTMSTEDMEKAAAAAEAAQAFMPGSPAGPPNSPDGSGSPSGQPPGSIAPSAETPK